MRHRLVPIAIALCVALFAVLIWQAPLMLAWRDGRPVLARGTWVQLKGTVLEYRHFDTPDGQRLESQFDLDGDGLTDCWERGPSRLIRPGAEGLVATFGSATKCLDFERHGL